MWGVRVVVKVIVLFGTQGRSWWSDYSLIAGMGEGGRTFEGSLLASGIYWWGGSVVEGEGQGHDGLDAAVVQGLDG